MRLLHVIPSIAGAHGGPSHAVARMAEALAGRGVAVTIATTDDGGPGRRMDRAERKEQIDRFAAMGVNLVVAPKGTEFYKVSLPLAAWLWRRVGQFDVVHIHALFSFSSGAAALAAARRGVPFVVRPLGVLGRYSMTRRRPFLKRLSLALIERPILRKAAAVHCTSKAEADEVHALDAGAAAVVIPLGVEAPAPVDAAGLVSEIAPPAGAPRLLFLSRLDPKKNLEGLLRAHALLQRRNDGAPFLIVAGAGDPAYVSTLRQVEAELGIADRVAWIGSVEGERKAATWAAADLFVLASHDENFGIAAAEAMLAGLPCVLGEGVALAADAAAAGAAVMTTTEASVIAARIAALLDDPPTAEAIGARGRRYAADRFSTDVMAQGLMGLYQRLAAARAIKPAPERAAA